MTDDKHNSFSIRWPTLGGSGDWPRIGLVALVVVLTYQRLPPTQWAEWVSFASGLLAGLAVPVGVKREVTT